MSEANILQDGHLEIKEHSLTKYLIFKRLCEGLKFIENKFNYTIFDCFAGSGKCILKETGEFKDCCILIARKTLKDETQIYGIEKHPKVFSKLKYYMKNYPNVYLYNDDCNKIIPYFETLIKKDKFIKPYPKLFILDSWAFESKWDTLNYLSKQPRVDLLINFNVFNFHRNWNSSFNNPSWNVKKLEEFIGHSKEGIFEKFEEKGKVPPTRQCVEYYIDRIKNELNYEYVGGMLIRQKIKGGPLYYWIFASHHIVPTKIIRDIMCKIYFGSRKEGNGISIKNRDIYYPINKFIIDDYCGYKKGRLCNFNDDYF